MLGEMGVRGGGLLITIREQSYTAFFFVIFFFMQKSCGQFVDVSDLNLVVLLLSYSTNHSSQNRERERSQRAGEDS